MSYNKNDNKILLVSLIAISLAATILGPYKARPADPNKGKDFDSGLTPPNALTTTGKTFQHTFTTAGTFPYFCQVHPGMAGTVIVK
jgi:Copper binding proteins, plastocyanin/azurin family